MTSSKGKLEICMSAPTNKAVSVLRKTLNNNKVLYKTIYALLGLRMEADGGVKELKDSGEDSLNTLKLIIVDEGSMISSILLEYMESKLSLVDTKVVIIGDKEQLPPVGEIDSPIWNKYPTNYELTEVMRHQNAILTYVQSIRANPNPSIDSPGLPVVFDDDITYMETISEHAERGEFHDGTAKAIAYRNMTVDFMNKFIRSKYPLTKSEEEYVEGDRIVFSEPFSIDKVPVASTDQEGVITSTRVTTHTVHRMLNVWKLGITLEGGRTCTATVIHENSRDMLNIILNGHANAKPKPEWYKFWTLKDSFQHIKHAYAITSHRSQGSTFCNIFVDMGDIFLNKNVEERTKCFYVACSRAAGSLNIFP
jgi:exodeoxyribonuclease-5